MKRAALFVLSGVGALACCAQAFALSNSSAAVKVSFSQPAGIAVVSPLVMPTVTATAISPTASFAGAVPSAGTSGALAGSTTGALAGNSTLTITGQGGDAVSMAVPESFQVVRAGGTEALTVKTNTNAAYGLSGDGVVLGGTGMGGSSMSVNVGGTITLASTGGAPAGDYEGLLVVVVQYN